MESSIACQLTARLAEFAPEVAAASEAVAELDCLLALALAARNLNLCRPEVHAVAVAVHGSAAWVCM